MKLKQAKGITVAEMMIVVGIIAILGAITITQFNAYARNNALQSAARDLAGDIKIVRQRAMAGSPSTTVLLPYTLQFLDNKTYTFTLPFDSPPYQAVPVTKDVTTFSPDITFVQNFGGNTMTFQTRGTITPGKITLTNSRGSTVDITTNMAGRINVKFTSQ